MPHDFVERILQSLLDMDYTQWAALGGAAAATYAAYRRYTRISFDDVPGPENPSFLHGTLHSNSRSFILDSIRARERGMLQGICHGCWAVKQERLRTII
jgi:hypothetical protein